MKTLLASLCLLIVLNSSANTLVAVRPLSHTVVSSFEHLPGHKQGNGHGLQCKFNNNSVVEHYEVNSTYEDLLDIYLNWYTVGRVNQINGIVKYVNYTVLPRVISYMIKSVFANGTPPEVSEVFNF